MKRNQIVMIYEDPITRQKREGKAKLLRLVRADVGDGLELWEVRFVDDGYTTTRLTNRRDV